LVFAQWELSKGNFSRLFSQMRYTASVPGRTAKPFTQQGCPQTKPASCRDYRLCMTVRPTPPYYGGKVDSVAGQDQCYFATFPEWTDRAEFAPPDQPPSQAV